MRLRSMDDDDDEQARMIEATEDVLDLMETTLPTPTIAATVLALSLGKLCAANKLSVQAFVLLVVGAHAADLDQKFEGDGFLQLQRGKPWEN